VHLKAVLEKLVHHLRTKVFVVADKGCLERCIIQWVIIIFGKTNHYPFELGVMTVALAHQGALEYEANVLFGLGCGDHDNCSHIRPVLLPSGLVRYTPG
jgi:hypothetical protein